MGIFERDEKLNPRLIDYLVIVGSRYPSRNSPISQTPELLRRYPNVDHKDSLLPPDVVFFCQPEGCLSSGPRRFSSRETTSFLFTLTDKDTNEVRYGICLNFYRSIERRKHHECDPRIEGNNSAKANDHFLLHRPLIDEHFDSLSTSGSGEIAANGVVRQNSETITTSRRSWLKNKSHTLTSLCIISHHPFFSKFRQCLYILKKIIEKSHEKSRVDKKDKHNFETVWSLITGAIIECSDYEVLNAVKEIEAWILRLLSAPVPIPGKSRVQLNVLPESLQDPLIFALPDKTRLSLVDFPLHITLELLGVQNCIRVLTCIMLEQKVILQSRDYNTLTMTVMALTAMLYPLQYMFPVIPLLPTCMADAEQLLMAPTPYIIGIPASFLRYKRQFFTLPADVWFVDLDTTELYASKELEPIPYLPSEDGPLLFERLQQVINSLSSSQPMNDGENYQQNNRASIKLGGDTNQIQQVSASSISIEGGVPFIYGNDVDSADVATRVALVLFFNSPTVLGNFAEHTRTLRLYPRPVVAFQAHAFLKSRSRLSLFTKKLATTQAVEFFAEWSICPENEVYQRIQTGTYDPQAIGDKSKWYSQQLTLVEFQVFQNDNCTLHHNWLDDDTLIQTDIISDESGSDSDGHCSSSSTYSNYNDFVTDIIESGVSGETPPVSPNSQNLTVELNQFYDPPKSVVLPLNVQAEGNTSSQSSSDEDEEDSSDNSNKNDEKTLVKEYDKSKLEGKGRRKERIVNSLVTESSESRSASFTPTEDDGRRGSGSSSGQVPRRPPPPTRIGSIGSHPGTPPGAVKVSEVKDGIDKDDDVFKKESRRSHLTKQVDNNKERTMGNQGGISMPSLPKKEAAMHLLDNIGGNITDVASQATNTLTEFLGNRKTLLNEKSPFMPLQSPAKLVRKDSGQTFAADQQRNNAQSTENQEFLKEIINQIFRGKIASIFNRSRVKKLMEDENYRNFVLSRLNGNLVKKISRMETHMKDFQISHRSVFDSMSWILGLIINGLEYSVRYPNVGGMASAFMLLEIMHTHYTSNEKPSQKDISEQARSESYPAIMLKPLFFSFFTKNIAQSIHEISDKTPDDVNLMSTVAGWWKEAKKELRPGVASQSDDNSAINFRKTEDEMSTDLLRDIVLKKSKQLASSANDVVNNWILDGDESLIQKSNKRFDSKSSNSTTAQDSLSSTSQRSLCAGSPSISVGPTPMSTRTSSPVSGNDSSSMSASSTVKSQHSLGYRYTNGQLIKVNRIYQPSSFQSETTHVEEIKRQLNSPTSQVKPLRTYFFEQFVQNRERSKLWDHIQFWEDVFLDAVTQERDIVGMDQRPPEMMDRYSTLSKSEKKRLELDEDRLLGALLHNMLAFMTMMNVNRTETKQRVRRLLAKCHVGLHYSQELHNLLENINFLSGNDIDLKPTVSRQMQQLSFPVHCGTDSSGDLCFMEVCEDCIILRSVQSTIVERWWYEKLVNMTCCPKTKIISLWWQQDDGKTHLKQFYSKKRRDLYMAIKNEMKVSVYKKSLNSPENDYKMGIEYHVTNVESDEQGLLQVHKDGIRTIFGQNQSFIPLNQIKRCFTQKVGEISVEQFDPKSRKIVISQFRTEKVMTIIDELHRAINLKYIIYYFMPLL